MQRWIKTRCFSLWPLHTRKGNEAGDALFPFALMATKNNFLALSHLTFLKTAPMAIMYFFNVLVAPAKEWGTWLAVLPSQPELTLSLLSLNYIALAEGAQVSLYHTHKKKKIQFCCSRRGLELLPGTGYVWHVPFHCCTHPHTLTHIPQPLFPS